MLSSHQLIRLAEFFREFHREPLYSVGIGDAVGACGANNIRDNHDATRVLCYLGGYSAAARLACPWMSTSWQICDLLEVMSGVLLAFVESTDEADVTTLCDQYRRELTALVRQKHQDAQLAEPRDTVSP